MLSLELKMLGTPQLIRVRLAFNEKLLCLFLYDISTLLSSHVKNKKIEETVGEKKKKRTNFYTISHYFLLVQDVNTYTSKDVNDQNG